MAATALSESEKEVFDGVATLLMEDDAFETTFKAFAEEHCGKFDDGEEQKLEYNDIYMKYREMFETLIEAHLASKGTDTETFFGICKKVVDSGDEREGFLPMLNAIADYDVFLSLMLETKEKMAA